MNAVLRDTQEDHKRKRF